MVRYKGVRTVSGKGESYTVELFTTELGATSDMTHAYIATYIATFTTFYMPIR